MPRLHIDEPQAKRILSNIPHKTCQKGIESHWRVENGRIAPQSICWLYCWGKPNTSSREAEEAARDAFDDIFDVSFERFDKAVDHEWARWARYSSNTELVDDQLSEHGVI